MDNLFWIAFSFAGVATVAALSFLVLWLQTKTRLAIALSKLGEQRSQEELIDALKDHTVHAAKSAALEAGQQLSSKLLDDHKRENEAARELHGKATKQITETLMQQALTMNEKLANLSEAQMKQRTALETVWRAMITPIGAGKVAEVGLENLLKSFGLHANVDYITQFSIQQNGKAVLRPDVVVMMPHGQIMVIDAKASKHLMDIASATDHTDEQLAKEQLKNTMNQHLKDLANKDYRTAIQTMYQERGRSSEISSIWSVMYVPSEMAIEHMHEVDPEFANKLYKADIILASRGTLHGLLSLARTSIENEKQVANSEKIVEAASNLLDGIITAFGHVDKLATSLKSSMDHFSRFAASANSSIINRAGKFATLGVTPSRGKSLPTALPRYNVSSRDASEGAEIVELLHIEKERG